MPTRKSTETPPAALHAPRRGKPALQLVVQTSGSVSIAPLSPRWLGRLLAALVREPLALTLRFVPRAQALALNRAFRGSGYAPNVLTFPYPELAAADVVICPPVVREQAREQGKPFAHHLAHMAVHGTLHALGHTHDEPGEAARMESLERAALARFGIPDPYA